MNQLDTILQQSFPTVMVPRHEQLAPLQENGERFLVCRTGLFIEVRRPWLHMLLPLCEQDTHVIPYGDIVPSVEFSFGKLPQELISRFIEDARAVFPNEVGAWLIWNDRDKKLEYRLLDTIVASPSYLEMSLPSLEDHESRAVELHSHGIYEAGFSPKDDKDDHAEIKISGVVGDLGRETPSLAFRLCTGGTFIPLGHSSFMGVRP